MIRFSQRPWQLACWLTLFLFTSVLGEEDKKAEASALANAIPKPIITLDPPNFTKFAGGVTMEITAKNDLAKKHVIQGLNHLHGGWEHEARRHFAEAMKADTNCLMAHWGMVMTMLQASPDLADTRMAATDRLLYLLKEGNCSEQERDYTYCLIKYMEEGAEGTAEAFRKIAKKYPDDLQAAVFAALFNRGGYDLTGDPTPLQEDSEKALLALVEKHPENFLPLHALLVIRAQAMDLRESLPLAKKLNELQPNYPPAFHILGHYEWRNGNDRAAATAFGRAAMSYRKWMRQHKISVADCPEWVKAESYRVATIISTVDFETAYAAAQQLAATELPKDRPSADGTRLLLWEAKTLPARILIHQGIQYSTEEAAKALPEPKLLADHRKHCLAYWWADGLRLALEAQSLSSRGRSDHARKVIDVLNNHIRNMTKTQKVAAVSGEALQWQRAYTALKVLEADVRGRIAMVGPPDVRDVAFNWFSSAADLQKPQPLMYPPMILSPMAARLGDYYRTNNQPEEAVKAYNEALRVIPNDPHSQKNLILALAAVKAKKDK